MRAGLLDRKITLQRYSRNGVDENRTPIEGWADIATVPAQIIQASTVEFIRNGGVDETAIIFRIRFIAGITNSDRIIYEGENFNIKEVKEIGRRKGLDLRCLRLSGND